MLHVAQALPLSTRLEVVEEYTEKLRVSGYSREQSRHVVTSGLLTYERRVKAAKQRSTCIYRSLEVM